MVKMFDVRKRVGVVGGLLVAAAAMSACAVDSGPTEETPAEAIAEVKLDNGTTVSFYEPRPGSIVIGQETRIDVAPVVTTGRSAVQLYQALAPDQPVPAPLVEAQARVDAAPSRTRHVATKPESGTDTSSFTLSWFSANFCYNESGWSFINCHADDWVRTNLTGTHPDVDEFVASLCVNTGSVTLRVWVDNEIYGKKQVNAGFCQSIPWESGFFGTNADIKDTTTLESASATYALAVKWNH